MKPKPERVDWESVAQALALARQMPAGGIGPSPPASGPWRIVSSDGSTSLLGGVLPNQVPTVEGLTAGDAGRRPAKAPAIDTVVAARPANRPAPGTSRAHVGDLLPPGAKDAGSVATSMGASKPVSKPASKPKAQQRPPASAGTAAGTRSGPVASAAPAPVSKPTGPAAIHRGSLDPQLVRVMDAWPALSFKTRQAILAMIEG